VRHSNDSAAVQESGSCDIFTNQFIEKPEEFKAPYVTMMKARSPQCFDHGFYRDANWDFQGWTDEQLWHNFIHSGQFEARPHRCVPPPPPLLFPPHTHNHTPILSASSKWNSILCNCMA